MSMWIDTLLGRTRRGLRSEPKAHKGQRKSLVVVKSVGARVPFDGHLLDPALRLVVVEDACWRASTEYWRGHRPPLWRVGARRRWRAEGVALREKRARIKELMDGGTSGPAPRR